MKVIPKNYVILHGDKVLIKEDEYDKSTEDGLSYIKKDDKKTIGTTVLNSSVNSHRFKVGDRIVYPTFAGVEVNIAGEDFRVLEGREIFFTYNDTTIRGVNGFVVVKPICVDDSSELRSVKKSEDNNTSGIVVSEPTQHENTTLSKGSEVVYSRYSGFPMAIGEEKYLVLAWEEIFFINKKLTINNE